MSRAVESVRRYSVIGKSLAGVLVDHDANDMSVRLHDQFVLASDYDTLAASHAELASQLEDARQIAREAEDRLIANRFSRVEFAEVLWDQIAFLESGQFERLDVEAQISALRAALSKAHP